MENRHTQNFEATQSSQAKPAQVKMKQFLFHVHPFCIPKVVNHGHPLRIVIIREYLCFVYKFTLFLREVVSYTFPWNFLFGLENIILIILVIIAEQSSPKTGRLPSIYVYLVIPISQYMYTYPRPFHNMWIEFSENILKPMLYESFISIPAHYIWIYHICIS